MHTHICPPYLTRYVDLYGSVTLRLFAHLDTLRPQRKLSSPLRLAAFAPLSHTTMTDRNPSRGAPSSSMPSLVSSINQYTSLFHKKPKPSPRSSSNNINDDEKTTTTKKQTISNTPFSKLHTVTVSDADRAQNLSAAPNHANAYYTFMSRNYERGWSQHFHYCPFAPGDTIQQSLKLYVYRLALLMGLKPGMKVLDVGCGIGAPAREMVKLVGCEVIGVTINRWQVDRATELTMQAGLGGYAAFVEGDYHCLGLPDGYFDAAYATESICHAKTLEGVYGEVRRVVKEGGVFGSVEWVMTEGFDVEKEEHRRCRDQIELGGGVASMRTVGESRAALAKVGWVVEWDEDGAERWRGLSENAVVVYDQGKEGEVVRSFSTVKVPRRDWDAARNKNAWDYSVAPAEGYSALPVKPEPPVFRPWWYPLKGDKHAKSLGINKEDRATISCCSPRRRFVAEVLTRLFITMKLLPPENMDMVKTMWLCVDSVVEGAQLGIFSHGWTFICRKTTEPPPTESSKSSEAENIEKNE